MKLQVGDVANYVENELLTFCDMMIWQTFKLKCICFTFIQKLKDVQDFLGLPQMELRSRQIKIHRGPLSDHIKNWDDVNKTLHGTAYECFLQTDYSS